MITLADKIDTINSDLEHINEGIADLCNSDDFDKVAFRRFCGDEKC